MSQTESTAESPRGRDRERPPPPGLTKAQWLPHRGDTFNRYWRVTGYLVPNLTALVLWLFFKILNRTTVIGKHNVGSEPNTLLLSNHQSMIDSFPVGSFGFFPRSLMKPHLVPWNPAAVENFYKSPVMSWFADNYKCIPIKEGRRDLRALHRMVDVLPHGVMTLFPEGGRSRNGLVGDGRPGSGVLILRTRPRVIPVAIDGMQDLLPIGSKIPRLFRRIYISFGPPVDYSEFFDRPRDKEAAQAVVDKVMEAIRRQHEEIREFRLGKRRRPRKTP